MIVVKIFYHETKGGKVTVWDMKREVLVRADVKLPHQFCDLSQYHFAFWNKLNVLGLRELKTPEDRMNVPKNVDKTVELTDDEYTALLVEFDVIHFG